MNDFKPMDRLLRRQQYEICQERGHAATGVMTASIPPWSICKYCRTKFRFEITKPKLIEFDVPKDVVLNSLHGVEAWHALDPGMQHMLWDGDMRKFAHDYRKAWEIFQ